MKNHNILIVVFAFIGMSLFARVSNNNQWAKDPSTFKYSLEYEQKVRADFQKQNQLKYNRNFDLARIAGDIKSVSERQRLNAVKTLGQIPGNNQIPNIEYLLMNDTSFAVRIECARSLKLLKSTISIPVLLTALNTNDQQLQLEAALSLAALGEKTESLKTLKEIGKTGDRNIVLNTHLGYLDIATEEAVEKLKTDLSDVNPYISVNAAVVLAELSHYEVAFPVLKAKLSDMDKYIRMAALRGLAYIGNDSSLYLIKGLLNDSDQLVKERSALILNKPVEKTVSTTYNSIAASNYADAWYNAPNPAYSQVYYNEGVDCANFVSQCLIAGGLSLYGGGLTDSYGCIPSCDNLNTNLVSYQGCTHTSLSGGYPSWFTQGDVVMFGDESSSPNDPWEHAAINVVTGTPALDAHTNNRYHESVGYYYPSTGTGFKVAEFYDFSSVNTIIPPNDNCSGAILLTSNTTYNYLNDQTVNNATASGLPKGPCDVYTGNAALADVWYYFKALATTHVVNVDPNGSQLDAVIVAYNSCSDNSPIACSDVSGGNGVFSTLTLSGLTIGNNYYIRVYDYGLQTSDGGFNICVTHASPAAVINSISEKVSIYPNPTTGTFEISGTEGLGSKCKVEIYDHLGRSIYIFANENTDSKINLDMSSCPAGIYLIKLSNNSLTCLKKIVRK
jgi:HEAT repeat protein